MEPQAANPSSPNGSSSEEKAGDRFEPDVFGKYFLLQRLAMGGMAEVLRAKSVGAGGFQKELVVKRIRSHLSQNKGFIRMLVNEAKITVGLNHPNIGQIYELGEIAGTWFMAMELVEGVSLAELGPLCRGDEPSLSMDHAVWIAIEVLKGLDHAHRSTDALGNPLNIVHCDVSPDNVQVTFAAGVKLLDFGIARAATELSNHREGQVRGKVNYLPPEQAVGKDVDARSDVYATGVTLYHTLTGAFPYGRFNKLEELVPLVKGDARYIPMTQHYRRLPEELDQIVRRAVATNPDERYPDARSMLVELEELLLPTPHSTIAEHLRVEIGRSFAQKKERLARLRGNDETVMRILVRRVEDLPAGVEKPDTRHVEVLETRHESERLRRELERERNRSRWKPTLPQLLVALLLAVGLTAAAQPVLRYFARGAVVVTSEPSGAKVTVDGVSIDGHTPLVVDDLPVRGSAKVRVMLSGHADWHGESAGDGRLVRQLHADLVPTVGRLEVVSVPRGAEVYLDDERVGRTPLTLEKVDLTVPHKLGLKKPGYLLDETVLQDLEPTSRVERKLEREPKPEPAPKKKRRWWRR